MRNALFMSLAAFPLALLPGTGTAAAQGSAAPANGGLGNLGSLGSILGGGIPSVGKVGAGNAAGLISYCVQNNYLKGANASSVLGRLTGKQGVTQSPGYTAGESGVVQAGGQALPLANLQDQVKGKLCDAILKRGASFLTAR